MCVSGLTNNKPTMFHYISSCARQVNSIPTMRRSKFTSGLILHASSLSSSCVASTSQSSGYLVDGVDLVGDVLETSREPVEAILLDALEGLFGALGFDARLFKLFVRLVQLLARQIQLLHRLLPSAVEPRPLINKPSVTV